MHSKFGAVKLNKILYFSDFLAFGVTGKPITGFEYQKLPNGPAPRRLVPVREKMIKARELGIQEIALKTGRPQQRTVNLREPDLALFTAAQISIVDKVIEALRDKDADTASELSHLMVGWQAVNDGETIPYETIFLSNRPLTEDQIRRGREHAARHEAAPA
jgi:hypothetical protein